MSREFLWYIPNTVQPGHRGDDTTDGWGSLDYSVTLARAAEEHGWGGALIGTGWGRPDTFTVATDRTCDLERRLGREHPPLEFGLRITTLVRDSTEEAWRDAEAEVERMASAHEPLRGSHNGSVGQQRLLDLAARGDVLDSCLYTAPGRHGAGGAGTTWLVGSAADVAAALERY
ncbi:hypothetical protein BJF78_00925 [Pseudonocardia sp. CNS-139]|nr:hypothetical protein BJF78_00925 [Pseudonocardia sp. CNS-139]